MPPTPKFYGVYLIEKVVCANNDIRRIFNGGILRVTSGATRAQVLARLPHDLAEPWSLPTNDPCGGVGVEESHELSPTFDTRKAAVDWAIAKRDGFVNDCTASGGCPVVEKGTVSW